MHFVSDILGLKCKGLMLRKESWSQNYILEGPFRNENAGPWSGCTQKVREAFSEKAFEDTETQN